ncbi:hypothetical protein [Hymenobacter sp. BRD67]|uniref:hypothetical protein n=1 Tax=Hymenobacter sp. BRD67 TaxID=2675877 RepID=UPI00156678C9|nr:hypothetical protein [Hymenobacter sp. BRD67]QKG54218.1 hypothetical protein GKZ67_18475 [Hymenobacter sp. BRD67]
MATFLTTEGHRRMLMPRTAQKRTRLARPLTYTVTATAYQAEVGQTDDEPFITADNSRIKPRYSSKMRWMALSHDLLARWGGQFQYGDKVQVKGISPELDGIYTIHDTMNRRHRHCMDILTHRREKLDIFTKNVKIQLAYRPPAARPSSTIPDRAADKPMAGLRLRGSIRPARISSRRGQIFKEKPDYYFASAIL